MSTEPMLPLVPWEQYMLLDDCPRGPMTFLFRLSFVGQLDRQRLARALAVVVARHRLLAAKVVRNRGRFKWDLRFEPPGPLCDVPPSLEVPFAANKMDLLSGNGFRVGICESRTGGQLWFEFHHAACDGLGAVEAIAETILTYRGTANELAPAPTASLLAQRAYIPLKPLERVTGMPRDLARIANFFRYRIEPLGCGEKHSAAEFQTSGFATHRFSAEETASLLDRARGVNATLNDLLLRDLYLSLHKWMLLRRESDSRVLRIAMPISHRLPDDGLGAVNRVSMVFLDRTAKQIRQPAEMLTSIARETRQIKKHRMGVVMLRVLKCLSFNTAAMQRVLRHPRSQVTCVLSNLGVVLSNLAGSGNTENELQFDAIEFMPPIRPQSPVSIGVHTYRGSLTLTLRHDSAILSSHDASVLLRQYVDELTMSISSVTRESRGRQIPNTGAN